MNTVALLAAKDAAFRVVAAWGRAFAEANVDAITALYAPEATMIGTFGTTVLTKPEQIRAYFETALNKDRPRTVSLNSSQVVRLGETNIVISCFDTITSVKDGQPVASNGRVTFVLSKIGPAWKILHFHRSPMPAA